MKKPWKVNGVHMHPDTGMILPADTSSDEWAGIEGHTPKESVPEETESNTDWADLRDPLERLQSDTLVDKWFEKSKSGSSYGRSRQDKRTVSANLGELEELIHHVARVTGRQPGSILSISRDLDQNEAVRKANKTMVDNRVKAALRHISKGNHREAAKQITEAAQITEEHNNNVIQNQVYPPGHINFDEERVSRESLPTSDRIKEIAYFDIANAHADNVQEAIDQGRKWE